MNIRGPVHKIHALGGEGVFPPAGPAPSCSQGPLAPYCLPVHCPLLLGSLLLSAAAEVGEATATAAALASHEPGFWLSSTPPVVAH